MVYDTSGKSLEQAGDAMIEAKERYGARIAFLTKDSNKVILVEQTKYSERMGQYVIDHRSDKSKIEKHCKWNDDKAIADAIRAAVEGNL